MARRPRFEESTSYSLNAIRRWAAELAERPEVETWVVQTERPVGVLFTVDSMLEHVTVLRVACADRYRVDVRPGSRKGVTRMELDPTQEYFAADHDSCRQLADILAHNKLHGLLRKAGEKGGERF